MNKIVQLIFILILIFSSFASYCYFYGIPHFLKNNLDKIINSNQKDKEKENNKPENEENNKPDLKNNDKPEENKDDYQSEEEKLRRLNNNGLKVELFILFVVFSILAIFYARRNNWKAPYERGSNNITKLDVLFIVFFINYFATLILESIISPFILMFFKDGKSFLDNFQNKGRINNYFYILIIWFLLFPIFIYILLVFLEKVFAEKEENNSGEFNW